MAVSPPKHLALSEPEMEAAIDEALRNAEQEGVKGKDSTPFLLRRVSEITGGRSLKVNLALLEQNARIAARIRQTGEALVNRDLDFVDVRSPGGLRRHRRTAPS